MGTTRTQLRSVSTQLDPSDGLTQIIIAEALGDRMILGTSDHR